MNGRKDILSVLSDVERQYFGLGAWRDTTFRFHLRQDFPVFYSTKVQDTLYGYFLPVIVVEDL